MTPPPKNTKERASAEVVMRRAGLSSLGIVLWLVATQALAGPIFNAKLNGASERPVPVVTDGTGSAQLTFNDERTTLLVRAGFVNLSGDPVAAHIHCCADANTPAGIAIGMSAPPSLLSVGQGSYEQLFDLTLASTFSGAFLANNGGTAEGARAALLNSLFAGLAYFNIHTLRFPAGEIRGQFIAAEPSLALIAGIGLIALIWLRRTRPAA